MIGWIGKRSLEERRDSVRRIAFYLFLNGGVFDSRFNNTKAWVWVLIKLCAKGLASNNLQLSELLENGIGDLVEHQHFSDLFFCISEKWVSTHAVHLLFSEQFGHLFGDRKKLVNWVSILQTHTALTMAKNPDLELSPTSLKLHFFNSYVFIQICLLFCGEQGPLLKSIWVFINDLPTIDVLEECCYFRH